MGCKKLQRPTLAVGIGNTHIEESLALFVGIHIEGHLTIVVLGIIGTNRSGVVG